MKKALLILLNTMTVVVCYAQSDYKASFFGCKSDGITNNTSSIQFAIDYISEKGGGKLNFYVGRYLTGGVELRSNVTIELHEGAVLVASPNINDFPLYDNERALLYGENISNVLITGKGVLEGDPKQYFNLTNQLKSGNKLPVAYLETTPSLLTVKNAEKIKIEGIYFQHAPGVVQKYINCSNLALDNLNLLDNTAEKNGLIVFQNCKGVTIKDVYVDTNRKAIIKDAETIITSVENCVNSEGKPLL